MFLNRMSNVAYKNGGETAHSSEYRLIEIDNPLSHVHDHEWNDEAFVSSPEGYSPEYPVHQLGSTMF